MSERIPLLPVEGFDEHLPDGVDDPAAMLRSLQVGTTLHHALGAVEGYLHLDGKYWICVAPQSQGWAVCAGEVGDGELRPKVMTRFSSHAEAAAWLKDCPELDEDSHWEIGPTIGEGCA